MTRLAGACGALFALLSMSEVRRFHICCWEHRGSYGPARLVLLLLGPWFCGATPQTIQHTTLEHCRGLNCTPTSNMNTVQ